MLTAKVSSVFFLVFFCAYMTLSSPRFNSAVLILQDLFYVIVNSSSNYIFHCFRRVTVKTTLEEKV